jgi:hypothetical protein
VAGTPDDLLALMPHAVALGITLHEATPERTTGSLAWAPDRCTMVQTELTDDQARLVAQTSQAQAVL